MCIGSAERTKRKACSLGALGPFAEICDGGEARDELSAKCTSIGTALPGSRAVGTGKLSFSVHTAGRSYLAGKGDSIWERRLGTDRSGIEPAPVFSQLHRGDSIVHGGRACVYK